MAAFDALAPDYDADFTESQIGRLLRGRVQERLLRHFSAGDHVLELGCGTGEDARFLAEQGVRMTATDASMEMLAIAKAKLRPFEGANACALDLRRLRDLPGEQRFAGAFSNFGALNCLDDWRELAAWLAERIEPGGIVGLGIMAPYCVWEFLWYSLHLDFSVALRRLRGSTFGELTIVYPTVRRITDDFAPYFQRVQVMPLGLFLPPTNAYPVVEKRPRLLNTLTSLEERFGNVSQLAMLADHYWIELRRT